MPPATPAATAGWLLLARLATCAAAALGVLVLGARPDTTSYTVGSELMLLKSCRLQQGGQLLLTFLPSLARKGIQCSEHAARLCCCRLGSTARRYLQFVVCCLNMSRAKNTAMNHRCPALSSPSLFLLLYFYVDV